MAATGRLRMVHGSVRDELRATRFTLVDADGRARLSMGPGEDGAAGLQLLDADERLRAQLGVDPRGATNLKLHDAAGEVCAWLSVSADGAPSLYLRSVDHADRTPRAHAQLCVDEHGCPVLSLHDRDGQPRVLLSLDERGGQPSFSFSDATGTAHLVLGEDVAGGFLHVYDRDGKVRAGSGAAAARSGLVPAPEMQLAAEAAARTEAERIAHEVAERTGSESATREVGALQRRLVRVERQAARGWIAALALFAVGTMLGARAHELTTTAVGSDAPVVASNGELPNALPGTIEARAFLLTGEDGVARARFALLPDGAPFLQMVGPDGESSAELSILPDDGPVFRLNGDDTELALTAPPHEPPHVGLYEEGRTVFQAPGQIARFPPPYTWP
jgi:hypothetical protein